MSAGLPGLIRGALDLKRRATSRYPNNAARFDNTVILTLGESKMLTWVRRLSQVDAVDNICTVVCDIAGAI